MSSYGDITYAPSTENWYMPLHKIPNHTLTQNILKAEVVDRETYEVMCANVLQSLKLRNSFSINIWQKHDLQLKGFPIGNRYGNLYMGILQEIPIGNP